MGGDWSHASDGKAPTHPTWGQAVSAPWMHMLRPARAAEIMAAASRPAFLIAFGLPVVFIAATVVLLTVWSYSFTSKFDRMQIAAPSFSEVWRAWNEAGWIGPAELLFLFVLCGVPALAAFAAWLFLPTVYRNGSVLRAYGRAYRGVASGATALAVLVAVCGYMIVPSAAEFRAEYVLIAWILTLAGLCGLVFWLTRALCALAGGELPVELPPRCEGCGYDLTHVPTNGLCPECALPTDVSLTPEVRRPGCAWERRQDDGAWIDTTIAALLSPQRFYAALRLRSPGPSRKFGDWHFLSIAVVAFLWLLACLLSTDLPPAEIVVLFPLLAMFLVPLLGWVLHRFVAAIATSCAITQRMLPDVRWARTVMLYETAFLWAFCLFNGAFISSIFAFEDWVSRACTELIGRRFIFGILDEFVVILAGNAALIVLWLRRYAVAFRAIRWSNF